MKKSKGLGDSVEKVLKATGLDKIAKKVLGDDCGCEKRKQALNKLYPYARVFTDDEIQIYKEIIPVINMKKMIDKQEQKILLKIYNKVFNTNKQISNCTSCIRQTLDKLNEVYLKSCNI